MTADDISRHITSTYADVNTTEAFGYRFFMYGEDRKRPFVSLADSDNEHETVSDLNRDGVYRINIGVRPETFQRMFANRDQSWDYTELNVFMPHHEYAAFNFVCILKPEGAQLEETIRLIGEAYLLTKERNTR